MIGGVLALQGTAPRREVLLWWVPNVLLGLAIGLKPLLVPPWIFPLYAVVSLGATTALVRRAHATARTGWWVALTVLPGVGLVVALWFLIVPKRAAPEGRFAQRPAYRVAQVLLIIMAFFVASRATWVPYWIPSGSMKPALLVGDFVITQPVVGGTVAHGDIVVFQHPAQEEAFVKRVIGLPGDTVAMTQGALVINDTPLLQTAIEPFIEPRGRQGPMGLWPRCDQADLDQCRKDQLLEQWPNGLSYRVLDLGFSPVDTMPVVTVPRGHMFVLGDNRDNATDSRISQMAGGVGMVPLHNVRTRARWVLFSSAGTSMWQIWHWRPDRFLKSIP